MKVSGLLILTVMYNSCFAMQCCKNRENVDKSEVISLLEENPTVKTTLLSMRNLLGLYRDTRKDNFNSLVDWIQLYSENIDILEEFFRQQHMKDLLVKKLKQSIEDATTYTLRNYQDATTYTLRNYQDTIIENMTKIIIEAKARNILPKNNGDKK